MNRNDRTGDAVRPALQGHDLKEGVQALAETAEVLGKGFAKQGDTDNRKYVEDNEEQCRRPEYARQRTHNGFGDKAGFRENRDDPEIPESPDYPEQTGNLDRNGQQRGRYQGKGDDGEIENIPAILEIGAAIGRQFQRGLDDIHAQAKRIEGGQHRSPHGRKIRGLKADGRRVGNNDQHHEAAKGGSFHQRLRLVPHILHHGFLS